MRIKSGLAASCLLAMMAACNSTRHVADGQYLLNKVSIVADSASTGISEKEMSAYLRQQPNHKMLWSAKMQLGVYNLSGNDTTKWWNRWFRRMGEAPVIYDSNLTEASRQQLKNALIGKGFLSADVDVDTTAKKKKMDVVYTLHPGRPHRISTIEHIFPNDTLRDIIMADSAHFVIRPGDPLDHSRLEAQRETITRHLRNRGYYAFSKEFITFNADTTLGSYDVGLTMTVNPPYSGTGILSTVDTHSPYIIRSVTCMTDYEPSEAEDLRHYEATDTVRYKNMTLLYGEKHYLRPSVIYDNSFLQPGAVFREADVSRTYQAFSRLGILKFINVKLLPAGHIAGQNALDAYILLTPAKSQSVAFEIEGTNSEGDLGVAAGITYTHRNIGSGSETLNIKLRGAYESIDGDLEGLIHNRYMEYSLEGTISFPKFKAPFLRESFKRKIRAATDFNLSMSYQERPEYTRIIAAAGWSYKWSERAGRDRHTFTPVDINYVYLPESTIDFIDNIAPDNPLLRYSYEDHFIMRMGYSFYHTNKRREAPWWRSPQRYVYTLRANAEIAGNLLFAINSIFTHRSNFHDNPYKIFGIRYSQYFKAEGDYGAVHTFNSRNALAWHAGIGVAVPYGNSAMLPFEKRFYGGGANGVRGWAVRTLGPGRYNGSNSVSDFIHQCGDIRLDLSVEYRAKLFWVVELGLFIDAGNIWTIHDYPSQPGGMFRFNSFYKEIAAAYGVGIRLDFNYFLLRVDLGMKAHDPAAGHQRWPLLHPQWGRDANFHFSIGYPF